MTPAPPATEVAPLDPGAADVLAAASDLVVQAARLVRAVRRDLPQSAGVRVLSVLDQHELHGVSALGVTALAEADRCSQPTMSGTVDRLLADGWVDKHPDPADARRSLVSLTDRGRDELARTRRANGERVARRLATDGSHSHADLVTAVAVLRAVLDETTTRPEGAPDR